ncbi:MAG TPA: histidine phosphatase family protein [Mycobacteriales bacterium]|nr:histidine phosphatase family protein [Mycobacteriales bacterium]
MTARAEVILWRHARSEWNAQGRFQGQLESDLDDVGRRQAAEAAVRLAELSPVRLVSSDSARARDTAAALAALTGLEVVVDARLREVDLGRWSGLTRDEVSERFPEQFADWQAGRDISRGGGETFAQVGERVAAVVREHLAAEPDPAGPLVFMTHGGTTLSALVALLELPPEIRRRLGPVGNARWSRLTPAPGGAGWRLAEHNAGVDERTIAGFGDDVARE